MGIFSSIKKSRGSDQSKEFTKEYELVATDDWLAELRPPEDDDVTDFGSDRRDSDGRVEEEAVPSIWHMPDVGDVVVPSEDHTTEADSAWQDNLHWEEPHAPETGNTPASASRRPSIWEPPAPAHHDELDQWNPPSHAYEAYDPTTGPQGWDAHTDIGQIPSTDFPRTDPHSDELGIGSGYGVDNDADARGGPLAVPRGDMAQALLDVLGAAATDPWEEISRRHADAVRYYAEVEASDPDAPYLRQNLNLSYAGLRLLAADQR